MRRIVRRTATLVTVQTWTVTWAEEIPAAEPPPAQAAPSLPAGPAHESPAPSEEPRTAPDAPGDGA